MEQLDAVDRSIVEILLRDGRTPTAQIGEKIGLSRPAVAERIEKLERASVILGTAAVISPTAVGKGVTAFVSARRGGRWDARSAKALEALMRRDEVVEVHTVAGDDCYLMKIRTDSIASLNTLVSRLSSAPLSLSTRTTIVMETHCEKVGSINLVKGLRK
jgi:Lrp/AsnC family transcriptional regulator, leucine-responsive regulatory protein